MIQPIPLAPLFTNTDDTGQRQGAIQMYNSYVDEQNNWRPMPGLKEYADLGTSDSVQTYWWSEKNYLIAVSANRVFYKTSDSGSFTEITISSGSLDTSKRIAFVGTYWRLYLADGGTPFVWTPGSDIVPCTNTQSGASTAAVPTNVTHLAILDEMILAANPSGRDYYFARLDATQEAPWQGGDTIQGLPDTLNALSIEWRDILLTGKRSVEMWYNAGIASPATPFARREGAFIQRGVLAPYSLIGADNTWFFLDHERKITRLQGVSPQIISTPIDKTLQTIDDLSDAFSLVINYRGTNWFILVCPSAGRTFAYEYRLQQWCELGVWYPQQSAWGKWPGNSFSYCESWNKHLLGSSKANGLVYQFDADTYQYDSDDIRMLVQTAAIDRGSATIKRCDRLIFRAKTGKEVSTDTAATLSIRYRSNHGDWSNNRLVELGTAGETENIYQLHSFGMYRTREWEFTINSATDRSIANVEEVFEPMTL